MALPTPLPTPPNSHKAKIEHSFSDDGHDNGTTDAPLFDAPRSERAASPTDAVLFPLRGNNRLAPASPSSPAFAPTASPKRRRLSQDEDEMPSPHKAVRSIVPSVNSQRPRQHSIEPYSPRTLPIRAERRHPLPSDAERRLVSTFHKQISSQFVDYGMEKWFTLRHDPASNTWLQPQFDMTSPTRTFAPISSNVQKRKSQNKVAKSVESWGPQPTTPKRQTHTTRAPRRRSTATPTNNPKSETRSTRNPANKPLVSKNYNDWPDYAPSADTMHPDAIKFARNVPQMSGSKDLSNDPLRNQLSEAELIAAHRAGMDCARYLCTKRSVFVGYVKHLRYHAEKYQLSPEDVKKGLRSWNKTAAQGCSGIDVNKTSALWQHFWLPIGWFNKDLFQDIIEADEVYFPKFDKDGAVVPQYDKHGNLMH